MAQDEAGLIEDAVDTMPTIDSLSPAAQDYVHINKLAGLCSTPSGLVVLYPDAPMRIPSGTTRVLWCAAVAARQLEIEAAKGSAVDDTAAKYGIELIAHERILIRAKWRSLRGLFGGPRAR